MPKTVKKRNANSSPARVVARANITGVVRRRKVHRPLDWYKVTEQTKYVLNNTIARYVRERMAETRKPNPNHTRISELTNKIDTIVSITRSPQTFQSIRVMQQLLQQYSNDA